MSEERQDSTGEERATARRDREFGPDSTVPPWKQWLIGFGVILAFLGIVLWTVLAA